jgi:hypothetical protein
MYPRLLCSARAGSRRTIERESDRGRACGGICDCRNARNGQRRPKEWLLKPSATWLAKQRGRRCPRGRPANNHKSHARTQGASAHTQTQPTNPGAHSHGRTPARTDKHAHTHTQANAHTPTQINRGGVSESRALLSMVRPGREAVHTGARTWYFARRGTFQGWGLLERHPN